MTRQESFGLTARISALVSKKNPVVRYTDAEVKDARKRYGKKDLYEMRELGLFRGDFEQFFVIREFCNLYGIPELADDEYTFALFSQARRLDADGFMNDPYIQTVRFPPVSEGNIAFSYAEYDRGEILLYDEPELDKKLIVPKLGFFNRQVTFPTVYEGEMPWMSVCPSEINSMREQIAAARGNVLVLGLGLGYYPFSVSEKEEVQDVVIIEKNPIILRLFQTHLLPQFPHRNKIELIEADAVDYVRHLKNGVYDFCFADIWEGVLDGAPLYEKIKAEEARLSHTAFTYWIEPQIRAYLGQI